MSAGIEFRIITKRAKQAAPKERPDLALAVSDKGSVTLTLAHSLMDRLGWSDGQKIELRAGEAVDIVFFELQADLDADFILRPPPIKPGNKSEGRRIIALGKCGGIELASRRSASVIHEITHDARGTILHVSVPRVIDGEDADDETDGDETPAAPAKPVPPPAARPAAAAKGVAATLDLESAAAFALKAAAKAWPTKISIEEPPVKVAAGVALVELGFPDADVRAHLDIEHMLLPAREDMKNHSLRAATDALEALREAAE